MIHTYEEVKSKLNIGIALSGGGARGIAHIGVLYALHELGIFPSCVSGSSAGALIGSMYCKGMSPLEMLELMKDTSFSKIFRVGFTTKGLNSHKYLQDFLLKNIGPIDFKELKIPLFVGVTNIDLGRFEVHRFGDLVPSVMASCSIPLLFKSVLINGQSYVDGGVMNNLPVEPLLDSCDKVIGIGVHQHTYAQKVAGMRDIGIRTFQLAIWNTMEERMKKCDIALDLSAAGKFGMFEMNRASELFEIGKEAVFAQSDAFQKLVEGGWNKKAIFR